MAFDYGIYWILASTNFVMAHGSYYDNGMDLAQSGYLPIL